jgi:LmbE family N-acetylglucosaminyl deacetylase
LGVHLRINLDLPNRRLFDSFEARVALAKEFRKYRPKLVIGFGEKTPQASPDHFQAVQITDAAVFYSQLTKWDEHFDHLPVHKIPSYLYYTLAFGSLGIPPGVGQLVVDISDTLETKLAAIHCYESQFPPWKTYVFERVKAFAMQQGQAAGYAAGEMFGSPRALGTKDLMHFLFGPQLQEDKQRRPEY